MKLNIIGPSCVGKTTLASKISKEFGINSLDLDEVFIDFDYLEKTRRFKFVKPEIYLKRIGETLNNRDWIAEGVFPVIKIMNQADLIVYVRLFWLKPLIWQWRRYFTDKKQREVFGLRNNLILSKDIIRQYTEGFNQRLADDPTYFNNRKTEVLLERYRKKVYYVSDDRNIDSLFNICLTRLGRR